jgi:hypothetical protein
MLRILFVISLFLLTPTLFAQSDSSIYASYTTASNRAKLFRGITRNIGNLSKPLTDSTEDLWQDAFSGMELINYHASWADNRIKIAFDSIGKRSFGFQRSLLELVYTNYPDKFIEQVNNLADQTTYEKIFAMCAEYLWRNWKAPADSVNRSLIKNRLKTKFSNRQHPILKSLQWRLDSLDVISDNNSLRQVFTKNFLPGNVVMFSFQRKDRDYPGLVLVRDTSGNFIKDIYGQLFNVPQLARSISNLPGYLTDGSTPQGIFRMYGFDVSRSQFIGPTTNIQLTMPGETSLRHFMNDTTIVDSVWSEEWYAKLLPAGVKSYFPLYESYYAGMAGRTEIISHGTTVDPTYYSSKKYFPYTPTEGCLCTKELWDPVNGRRVESDQQKLVNAISKAGGPFGYCVVIELNDEPKPVTITDVLKFTSTK